MPVPILMVKLLWTALGVVLSGPAVFTRACTPVIVERLEMITPMIGLSATKL